MASSLALAMLAGEADAAVRTWTGAASAAGVTAPSATWFLAEGATGSFFETFLLLANPGSTSATATITYLPETGNPVSIVRTLPARGRVTLNVEQEAPSLAKAAVSNTVAATQPILVNADSTDPIRRRLGTRPTTA